MRRAVALLLGVLVVGLAIVSGAAQESAELTVETPGSGDPITVGDPIVFRIEVRHAEDARVEVESAMTPLGRLDASLPEIEELEPGLTAVRWRTAAFEVGIFEVTLPPIMVVSPGSEKTLTPKPQRIEVISALPAGAVEPRPLTPPQEIGDGSSFAFWVAALLAIGVGFVLARVLGIRARRRDRPAATAAPQAEGLPDLPSAEQGMSAADVCRALALTVRVHLERRYDIPARSLTSAELPAHLAAADAPAATVQRVRTLLRECDAATFANQTPPPERLDGYRQLAAAIIESDGASDPERPDATG